MNSVTISLLVVPAVVALLLFLVFTYLYEQTRQDYFRAWQLGWGAYTLHYVLDAWSAFRNPSAVMALLASLLLAAMALCIFISTRLMREKFRLRWYDLLVTVPFSFTATRTGEIRWPSPCWRWHWHCGRC